MNPNSPDILIETLVHTLAMRDTETEEHTRRVAAIAVELSRLYGLSKEEQLHMQQGALLHDIGKIAIPDRILLKKGPLSIKEYKVIQRHPVIAGNLLGHIPALQPAMSIPYHHHERWDGSGYPEGLKWDAIPVFARIFSVADVWDALLSNRPYRPAWSEEAAFEYILQNSGILFDPEVVSVFLKLVEHHRDGK